MSNLIECQIGRRQPIRQDVLNWSSDCREARAEAIALLNPPSRIQRHTALGDQHAGG